MTQGAAIRSERNAARKVSVRQRPCGTLATSRCPRTQRPWRRVILVFAHVSSRKTKRAGSSRLWYFFHCTRRRATSGRSCSLACRLFFETDACMLEEVPDRVIAHHNPALCQFSNQRPQCHIRLLRQTSEKPVALARQRIGPIASHRPCRRAAGRAEPLRPFHHAGDADLEGRRHLAAALARRNRRHYTFAKIKRIGSGHQMLASDSSQHLESELHRFGNPKSIQPNKIVL